MKINFSFASVTMCVLATNLFLIFIYFIIKRRKILANVGYQMIGLFLILAIVRFFVPLEFESISHNINWPNWIGCIISNFQSPRFSFFKINCSLWDIVKFIWVIGILIFFIRYIKNYKTFIAFLREHVCVSKSSNLEQYESESLNICTQLKKKKNFRILELTDIPSPMVCYWKGYCILLPQDMKSSDSELRLVLTHEIHHIIHHDLLIKLGTSILTIIYWWNPFCYLLKNNCNLFLEMRIDHLITQNDSEKKISYLELLLQYKEQTNFTFSEQPGLSFFSNNNDLIIRFATLTQTSNSIFKRDILLILWALFIFICSYFFIFQSNYLPPELYNDATLIIPTPDNSYFIKKEDGTYNFYINNEYFETTDSTEYYDSKIPIYTEGEFDVKK